MTMVVAIVSLGGLCKLRGHLSMVIDIVFFDDADSGDWVWVGDVDASGRCRARLVALAASG
ncbi:hypothetical protein A9762_24095 [Pandoraea sp. ISTKB]|nr:hypothetical protein A9762_24095 [Pandoraea sp. ISTKB]